MPTFASFRHPSCLLAASLFLLAFCAVAQQGPTPTPPPKEFRLPEPTPPGEFATLPEAPRLEIPDQNSVIDPILSSQSVLGRSLGQAPPPAPTMVIRAIIGFVFLLALAYLAGHPKIQSLERKLNVAHLTTTGLPFLLLGVLAAHPRVGVLTPTILAEIAPLLPFGLGWIGFVVGARFAARGLRSLPTGTGTAVILMTAVPVVAIHAVCAYGMLAGRFRLTDWEIVREALLLGIAGAMAARSAPQFLLGDSVSAAPERLGRIIESEQLAGVIGLMLVSVYFHPDRAGVAWQLPATAWLFMVVGIGATLGLLMYAVLQTLHKSASSFTAALLGCVAFTSGIASFLGLSPLAVCFIAGAILINADGSWRDEASVMFEHLERPVYFLFMTLAGALWNPTAWQGWLIMALFVSSRFLSKWAGCELLSRFFLKDITDTERKVLTAAPMGALSVAVVMSAYDLYSSPMIPWAVTAVFGGSLVTEAILQVAARKQRSATAGAQAVLVD